MIGVIDVISTRSGFITSSVIIVIAVIKKNWEFFLHRDWRDYVIPET